MIRQFLYCFLFVMNLSSCKSTIAENDMLEICWPNQNCFNEKISKFSISPKEAYKLLKDRIKKHPRRDAVLMFIIGDEYFFTKPRKTVVPLKGFFLNGKTLEVEYRESNVKIKSEMKRFPKNAFTKIEKIE